jgi:hypothetical protein
MKRITLIVLILVACCLSFAAGQEAEKLKWPWAKEKWSKDAGLSVLEVELLKANVDAKPIKPAPYAEVGKLTAEAKEKGLHIQANVVFTKKISSSHIKNRLSLLAGSICLEWQKRFGHDPTWEKWPIQLDLLTDGKKIHTRVFNTD